MADVKMNFRDSSVNDGNMKVKGFLNNSIIMGVSKHAPAKIFVIKTAYVNAPKVVLS